MRYIEGDLTVGDVGVPIELTANVSLTGKTVYFKLSKPSGAVIVRTASVSGYTATYTTIAGDIDEAGEWRIFAYESTTGYHFTKESGHLVRVRPKPEDMAAYE